LVELLAYGYENPFLRKIIPVILSEAEVGGATSWGGSSACVLNYGSSDMYLATHLMHMVFQTNEEGKIVDGTLKEQYEPIIMEWIEQSRGVTSYEKWDHFIFFDTLENDEIIAELQRVMNGMRSRHSARGHKNIQFPVVDSFESFLNFPTDV
jgi:hypothetical protein